MNKPRPWQRRLITQGHRDRLQETRELLTDVLSPDGAAARIKDADHCAEVIALAQNAMDALDQQERAHRTDSFAIRAGLALHDAAQACSAVTNSAGFAWFRGELYKGACRLGEASAWLAASAEVVENGASGRGGRPADLETKREIRRKWDRLASAGKAEHERASIIAREMNVTPEAVRRQIKTLGLRKTE
jgi:hypothetical protein